LTTLSHWLLLLPVISGVIMVGEPA